MYVITYDIPFARLLKLCICSNSGLRKICRTSDTNLAQTVHMELLTNFRSYMGYYYTCAKYGW